MNLNTDKPHFIVLFYIALHRYCVFYKLKVCGSHVTASLLVPIFLTVIAHFMFLCHILVILSNFKLFHYYSIFYGNL